MTEKQKIHLEILKALISAGDLQCVTAPGNGRHGEAYLCSSELTPQKVMDFAKRYAETFINTHNIKD